MIETWKRDSGKIAGPRLELGSSIFVRFES